MLASVLPAPKHHYADDLDDVDDAPVPASSTKKKFIPPYLQRQNFIPVDLDDFDDGGAYPEVHVVQYPLNMGKPGVKSTAVISVNVDEKGQVQYDALVKQGQNRNKIVQSSLSDIKEKEASKDQILLPDEKEEQETAERTRQALENLLEGKIRSAKPNSVVHASEVVEPTYIRYTPNPDAPGYNPEAQQRVIRMVEAQVDPMEPPKHKHKKVPRGPPSPPVPVLHSPPRKLTVADQQAWKVPPCVSNWKNARGYTIPLDKRLAADGRGLQEVTINNKFAMLSEALYIAERKATEDLRIRNQIRKKMAMREKEDKEQELRDMAMKARMERAGVAGGGLEGRVPDDDEEEYEEVEEHGERRDKDEGDLSPPVSQRAREGRGGEDDEGREGTGGRRSDRPSSRDWMGGGGGGVAQVPSGVNPAAAQGRRGVSNLPAWMTKGLAEKGLAQTQTQARGDEKGNRGSDDDDDDDRRHRARDRDTDRDAERDRDRDRSDRRRDDDDDDRRRARGGRGDSRDRDGRPDSRSRDRDRERDRSPGRARKVSNLPSWMTDVTAAMRKGEIDRTSGAGKDRDGDRERDGDGERDLDRRRDGSSRRDGRSVERSRGRVREASEDRDIRARTDSRDHRRRREGEDEDEDRAAGARSGRKRDRDEGSDEDQRRAVVTGDRDRGRGGESAEERADRQKREQLRVERRKERERELRLENMKGAMRKKKIDRDEGRDISEKIALGMLKGTGNLTGEALFDSRLFNQSSGMDSGFAADDEYTTYSKPLFDRGEASSIYRPKRDDADVYGDADAQLAKLTDTSRFKPDKGFKGTQGAAGGSRAEPVQFEKAQAREEDPFGINDIVKSKRSRHDDD